MTLKDALEAFKAGPKHPNYSPEFEAIISRTRNALIASGQAERALKAGDRAPPFDLPDQDGARVASTDLLKTGPLVLSFYRGVWCTYCNIEQQALQAALGEILARDASLVAISQQTPSNNRKSRRVNDLHFPILSDKGGQVGAAFGLRWQVPEEMRDVHRQLGSPLPVFNGEDSWTLSIPARYVISQDEFIAYAQVDADYRNRPEPSDLFPVIDQLRSPAPA